MQRAPSQRQAQQRQAQPRQAQNQAPPRQAPPRQAPHVEQPEQPERPEQSLFQTLGAAFDVTMKNYTVAQVRNENTQVLAAIQNLTNLVNTRLDIVEGTVARVEGALASLDDRVARVEGTVASLDAEVGGMRAALGLIGPRQVNQ